MKNVLLIMEFYITSVQRLRKGVVDYARENNWRLSIVYRKNQLPKRWSGDGILTHINTSPPLINFLKKHSNIPVVSYTAPQKKLDLPYSIAHEDDFKIGKIAARHFIENGCQHACWYGNSKPIDRRGRSFIRAMRHKGIETSIVFPARGQRTFAWDEKNNWLAGKLRKLPLPCCIFCENDLWAYDLLEGAIFSGLRVPEDISILGVDNDSLICDCVKVPLSSVDNRLEKVGYEGSALLADMMDGRKSSGELVLIPPAPEVVARRSTDILAVKHPALKRAIGFIRKNYDNGDISVKKISHAAHVSESGLRMLFNEHLDTSPLHLVHRLRIQKACKLLRETNMKIDSLAKQSGFNAPRRFYDIFRKEMNISPHEFRKEQLNSLD